MSPKISVIIPVYNVAEYISECIQSLAAQTFRDFEIILVDDCGTDNSIEIAAQELSSIDIPHKILHHTHNRGLSAARNTGLSSATGDYVYFLDSDDYITPDCLEKLYTRAIETNAEVTIGEYAVTGGKDQWLAHLDPSLPTLCTTPLDSYLNGQYYVMAWNKLCKRSFLHQNNISFIEGLVHEDEPWTFAIVSTISQIAIVKDITYVYRVREGSLQTGKDFTKHFNAYLAIIKEIGGIIKEKGLQVECARWFEKRKALYFAQTLECGTQIQQKEIYKLIHNTLPIPDLSKTRLHYYFPLNIGIILYKKFFKHLLC